jgi:hypothetical protein
MGERRGVRECAIRDRRARIACIRVAVDAERTRDREQHAARRRAERDGPSCTSRARAFSPTHPSDSTARLRGRRDVEFTQHTTTGTPSRVPRNSRSNA